MALNYYYLEIIFSSRDHVNHSSKPTDDYTYMTSCILRKGINVMTDVDMSFISTELFNGWYKHEFYSSASRFIQFCDEENNPLYITEDTALFLSYQYFHESKHSYDCNDSDNFLEFPTYYVTHVEYDKEIGEYSFFTKNVLNDNVIYAYCVMKKTLGCNGLYTTYYNTYNTYEVMRINADDIPMVMNDMVYRDILNLSYEIRTGRYMNASNPSVIYDTCYNNISTGYKLEYVGGMIYESENEATSHLLTNTTCPHVLVAATDIDETTEPGDDNGGGGIDSIIDPNLPCHNNVVDKNGKIYVGTTNANTKPTISLEKWVGSGKAPCNTGTWKLAQGGTYQYYKGKIENYEFVGLPSSFTSKYRYDGEMYIVYSCSSETTSCSTSSNSSLSSISSSSSSTSVNIISPPLPSIQYLFYKIEIKRLNSDRTGLTTENSIIRSSSRPIEYSGNYGIIGLNYYMIDRNKQYCSLTVLDVAPATVGTEQQARIYFGM